MRKVKIRDWIAIFAKVICAKIKGKDSILLGRNLDVEYVNELSKVFKIYIWCPFRSDEIFDYYIVFNEKSNYTPI